MQDKDCMWFVHLTAKHDCGDCSMQENMGWLPTVGVRRRAQQDMTQDKQSAVYLDSWQLDDLSRPGFQQHTHNAYEQVHSWHLHVTQCIAASVTVVSPQSMRTAALKHWQLHYTQLSDFIFTAVICNKTIYSTTVVVQHTFSFKCVSHKT